jgi:DNA-binding beta-propeller fold protein YncE
LKIDAAGLIHTFAGTHEEGFNGDGPDLATTLQISQPNGLYVLPNGTVYLLDPGNQRIRRVDPNGLMTTIVYDPDPDWRSSGRALWVSPDEQLIYYTEELAAVPPETIANGAVVKQWTPAGGIQVVCSQAVGFRNPGNIAVNPVDGKLYVTDRAEDDASKLATGLFRIDGPETRTRITGNITQPLAADGQSAVNSFIDQPRGIAFRADGSYFLCAHKDGNVWFVDTLGILHLYLHGRGSKDFYNLTGGLHPPLTGFAPNGQEWISQPRAVTLAPNGNLLVTATDSGFVFQVNHPTPPAAPTDLRLTLRTANGPHLSWTGVFGYGYRIERSFELFPASWQPIGAVGGNPAGVPTEFTDPEPATHPRCYYRILPAL